jgi:hypothetical protein
LKLFEFAGGCSVVPLLYLALVATAALTKMYSTRKVRRDAAWDVLVALLQPRAVLRHGRRRGRARASPALSDHTETSDGAS